MHKTPSIKDGQKRCTKLKHKEAWALKGRKELTTIARGVSQESTSEPTSRKLKRMGVRGFSM
jgi:hypothetical protein